MAEATVVNNNNLPPEVLTKIFEHCRPNLNELVNIVDVCQLSRDAAIREYNTSGSDLVIRHPDDINDLISLLCKPVSFTKLHIVWDVPSDVDCSSVSLDALANVTSLTHLQSFMLKIKDGEKGGYSMVLNALLTLLLQTSTDTLTHFKLIKYTTIDVKVVELLEACQHLSHLVLNGCNLQGYQRRCMNIIPTLTHLELLDVRGTSSVLEDLSFIAAVKRGCPNISNNIMIRELAVGPLCDVSMVQFVSHVGRLYIEEFATEHLRSFISCLNERVSQLNVDDLTVQNHEEDHLTDDILLSLVQSLRGLKEVVAQGCHHLTNEGVVNVIRSSPELEEINIDNIKNITTDIIQLLEHVVTEKNVNIKAYGTKLSDEMRNNPDHELYTGKNGNICLKYRWWQPNSDCLAGVICFEQFGLLK